MGSRDAEFAEFVGARRPALVRTARLLTAGDVHLAEDLVQTALTKLYVAWPRVRSANAEPYARTVLVNAFTDLTRRPWWRRETSSESVPDRMDGAAPIPDGSGDAVRAALAALPAGQRTAVVLRHWLDLDVAECARLMRVDPGTVKSQTARGLAKLRTLLDDELERSAP